MTMSPEILLTEYPPLSMSHASFFCKEDQIGELLPPKDYSPTLFATEQLYDANGRHQGRNAQALFSHEATLHDCKTERIDGSG